MKYVRKTITLPLTLEADDLQLIHWWIDGAFATHRDMRSHTGGAMSLGKGIIYGTSTRQKSNTRSSTEACPKYSGHAISSTLKATTSTIALYVRTIRVPFF